MVVDEHHVVSFAPPVALVLNDALRHSDILAWTFSFKHDVVCLTISVACIVDLRLVVGLPVIGPPLVGLRLAILGEEVEHARREFLVFLPIDVVVKGRDILFTFVSDGDSRRFVEWHREEAIERTLRPDRKRPRFIIDIFA